MAAQVTQIRGTVYLPSGDPAAGITLTVRLSARAKATVDGAAAVIGGVVKAVANVAGYVELALVPNDILTPAGTHYVVEYVQRNGVSWQERWNVPSGGPLDIGAVPAA